MQKYFGIGLTCGLLVASVSAQAFTGQQFTKDAKVGIAEARSIALKAHPGKIVDEELEKEAGEADFGIPLISARNTQLRRLVLTLRTGPFWRTR